MARRGRDVDTRVVRMRRNGVIFDVDYPTVESRLLPGFREPTTDNPGVVLDDAGNVYLVEPDGTRVNLSEFVITPSAGLPTGWTADDPATGDLSMVFGDGTTGLFASGEGSGLVLTDTEGGIVQLLVGGGDPNLSLISGDASVFNATRSGTYIQAVAGDTVVLTLDATQIVGEGSGMIQGFAYDTEDGIAFSVDPWGALTISQGGAAGGGFGPALTVQQSSNAFGDPDDIVDIYNGNPTLVFSISNNGLVTIQPQGESESDGLVVHYDTGGYALSVGDDTAGATVLLRVEEADSFQVRDNDNIYLQIVAGAQLGFFGADPVAQQDATDGASLITALQNYGLLDEGSSWTDGSQPGTLIAAAGIAVADAATTVTFNGEAQAVSAVIAEPPSWMDDAGNITAPGLYTIVYQLAPGVAPTTSGLFFQLNGAFGASAILPADPLASLSGAAAPSDTTLTVTEGALPKALAPYVYPPTDATGTITVQPVILQLATVAA